MLCRFYRLSSFGLCRNVPESQRGVERKQDMAENHEQWHGEHWWKGCRIWSEWGILRDFHLLRFPVWKACLPGLWCWRARACGTLEKPIFPSPTLLSYLLSACCAVLSHWALWEKTLLQQQQQDNKGHVSERTGRGRRKGDFGSDTPSSRAFLLPSSPSSLNQMGRSHRDHPAPRGTTSLPVGAQMMSSDGIFVASPLLPDRHFTFSWAQHLFPWPTLSHCPIYCLVTFDFLWTIYGCSQWFERMLRCCDHPRDLSIHMEAPLPSYLSPLMESAPMAFLSVLFSYVSAISFDWLVYHTELELLIFKITKSLTSLLYAESSYPAVYVKCSSLPPTPRLPEVSVLTWSPAGVKVLGASLWGACLSSMEQNAHLEGCSLLTKWHTQKHWTNNFKGSRKKISFRYLELGYNDPKHLPDFLKRYSTFHPDV